MDIDSIPGRIHIFKELIPDFFVINNIINQKTEREFFHLE